MSNFLDTKDKAFWRALLGVVSLGVSIGLPPCLFVCLCWCFLRVLLVQQGDPRLRMFTLLTPGIDHQCRPALGCTA